MQIEKAFSKALKPQLRKNSSEYRVLYLLKHCFPEWFRYLRKAEAPDLQDSIHATAVEVTEAVSEVSERIRSEYVRYSEADTLEKREKSNLKIIYNSVRSKTDKLNEYYASAFKSIGLALLIDCPINNELEENWFRLAEDAQRDANSKFDFFFLIGQQDRMIAYYNCLTEEKRNISIEKNNWDRIKIESRLVAEGTAVLSSRGEYSQFSFGEKKIVFYTGKTLDRYLNVREWDNGYIVVDCRLKDKPDSCEEDYIDLLPVLENLYIDPEDFLNPIKEVRIIYDD